MKDRDGRSRSRLGEQEASIAEEKKKREIRGSVSNGRLSVNPGDEVDRSEGKFLTGERIEKKRGGRHATGGAYLNSRLTFIYLATFNFYGRDLADRLASQVAPAVWSEFRRDPRLDW